jgi:hypothetical protein
MVKYNRELLDECLVRDCATLTGEYMSLTRDTKIKYKCKCGNEGEKTFKLIYKNGGAYCEGCCKVNTNNKKMNKRTLKYSKEFLDFCMERDGSELTKTDYSPLNLRTIIEFKCGKCNKEDCKKTFECISKSALCRKCSIQKTNEEHNKTIFIYDRKLLLECMERDKAALEGEYENLDPEVVITYTCSCGEKGCKKTFRRINTHGGAYCQNCSDKNRVEKVKLTNLENYGVTCSLAAEEIKEKSKVTNLERRGVEYALQSKEVRDKIKATFKEKYGFENAMQNPEVAERNLKACLTPKNYTLPDGTIIKYQGYENFAFDILFNDWELLPTDIIVERTKVPEIWWVDDDNKRRRYYTDIHIHSKNLIIEVKSTWTYKIEEKITQQKLLAAKELGYNTLLWVFDYKHNLVEEYENYYF